MQRACAIRRDEAARNCADHPAEPIERPRPSLQASAAGVDVHERLILSGGRLACRRPMTAPLQTRLGSPRKLDCWDEEVGGQDCGAKATVEETIRAAPRNGARADRPVDRRGLAASITERWWPPIPMLGTPAIRRRAVEQARRTGHAQGVAVDRRAVRFDTGDIVHHLQKLTPYYFPLL